MTTISPSKCVASYINDVKDGCQLRSFDQGFDPTWSDLLVGWSANHSAAETEDGFFTTGIICGRQVHMCDVGIYEAYEGIWTPGKRTFEKKVLLIFGKSLFRFKLSGVLVRSCYLPFHTAHRAGNLERLMHC